MESQVGTGLRSPPGGIQMRGSPSRGGRKETSLAGEEEGPRPPARPPSAPQPPAVLSSLPLLSVE